MIDQIDESEIELRRCLNSFHVDFFLYKLSAAKYARFFSILTSSTSRMDELLADTRCARAFDACVLLCAEKAHKAASDNVATMKTCLTSLGDYFLDNMDSILATTKNGIFAMRSFLKVLGRKDQADVAAAAGGGSNQRMGGKKPPVFSMKTYDYKVLPDEWNMNEYLNKFYKKLKDKNMLGSRRFRTF